MKTPSFYFVFLPLCLPASAAAAVLHVPGEYPTIQAAVNAASIGDTVLVADGTYTGAGNRDITLGGKDLTIVSENGPADCIIDCERRGRGFYFPGTGHYDTIIGGFTIRHGSAQTGGAIYISDSHPVITDCIFHDNESTGSYGGGAVYLAMSMTDMVGCVFVENHSTQTGGALSCYYPIDTDLVNCLFERNTSGTSGGAVGVSVPEYEQAIWIRNCRFCGNSASSGGALSVGGLVYADVRSCTFSGNQAGNGGAVAIFSEVELLVQNSILYGDTAMNGSELYLLEYGDFYPVATVRFSDIQGGEAGVYVSPGAVLSWGDGNMDADPLFVSGPMGDYYLSQIAAGQAEDSPCVDTGSDLAENVSFELPDGDMFMSELTTRTDLVTDRDVVDLGYHYPPDLPVTPSPTPTVGPGMVDLDMDLNRELFTGDDTMILYLDLFVGAENVDSIIYIVIEILGGYYFMPTYVTEPTVLYTGVLPANMAIEDAPLAVIPFPTGSYDGISGAWHGAVLNQTGLSLLDYDMVVFSMY